jgi:hypothetical protein
MSVRSGSDQLVARAALPLQALIARLRAMPPAEEEIKPA